MAKWTGTWKTSEHVPKRRCTSCATTLLVKHQGLPAHLHKLTLSPLDNSMSLNLVLSVAITMGVTIDHQTYPNIINRIIDYVSTPTLLAISLTCKELRERIFRGRRFESFAIACEAVPDFLPRNKRPPVKTVTGRRLALYSYSNPRWSAQSVFSLASQPILVPQAIRVLESPGNVTYLTKEECGLFRRVEKLRRMHNAWLSERIDDFPHLDTIVDYVNLTKSGYPHVPSLRVPRQQPRLLVTHIDYGERIFSPTDLVLKGNGNGGNYAICLWPDGSAAGQGHPRAILYPLLASILEPWKGDRPISIIIAGMDRAVRNYHDFSVQELVDNMEKYMRLRLRRTWKTWRQPRQDPPAWLQPANLKVLTHSVRILTHIQWERECENDDSADNCYWKDVGA